MDSPQEGSRPVSYYENSAENPTTLNNNVNKECKFSKHPTQTHCLNTTVPQNIAVQDLGGKHTPTRNSLRHSRMIVLNRYGQAITSNDVPLLRYNKFVKGLLVTIISSGVLLCFISLWLLVWSPNIRARDNPCWSAIPILISGIFGILLLRSYPKQYPSRIVHYWIKSLKYISITISAIATVISIIIFFLALAHVISILVMDCSPVREASNTCVCKTPGNSTEESFFFSDYHYVDLSCPEVKALNIVVIIVCVLNAVVSVFELVYLLLVWKSRKMYYYSSIPTNDNGKGMKDLQSDR